MKMKTHLYILILFIFGHVAHGQQYELKFSLDLTDTLSFQEVKWADADNDGLLDVVAFGTNSNGETKVVLLKNDSLRQLQFSAHFNTSIKNAAWLITDIDGDNFVDILISGSGNGQPLTAAFLNRGGFTFEGTSLFNLSADVIRLADLNQDGSREILLSGTDGVRPFLQILERQATGWVVVNDSINIAASSIEVFDFDDDNDLDFFVTGIDDSGLKVTGAFYNRKGFHFAAEEFSPAVRGVSTRADLNHDGAFDILIAGEDSNNEDRFFALLNNGPAFSVKDTIPVAGDAEIFAADLNSDGRCDINIFGLDATGDTLNVILPRMVLPHANVISQTFGDGEHDGDLDLLQLVKTPTGFGLRVLRNTIPATNFPPQRPSAPIVANIFSRLFMYWEKPLDDRTAINSLTFDVSIRSTGEDLMVAGFDLFNGKRLTVEHGNNGTANYVLIRTPSPGPVSFDIQAVDNSFHAGPGSRCKGSGGGGLCSAVETVNIEACKNERVTLTGESVAHWFSFADGFLADARALAFDFHGPDTIFSATPGPDCPQIKVYVLATAQTVTKITESVEYACENQALRLGVEPNWPIVEWSSTERGFLSDEDSIDHVVTVPDTVKVKVSDGAGCVIQRNTAVKISKPLLDAAHEAYQILKGESVQLSASGGSRYQWAPVSGLSDPQVANPVASPLKTTEYVVTIKDSLGCAASARVVVMVEETAFVPNLFTPNRDGTNDVLRIYGLGQVRDFSFTIYNREGSRVYHTKDISDAIQNGWNGTAGGVDQPSGVYYWNVEGATATGRRLQLNGKNSGSIVLVR